MKMKKLMKFGSSFSNNKNSREKTTKNLENHHKIIRESNEIYPHPLKWINSTKRKINTLQSTPLNRFQKNLTTQTTEGLLLCQIRKTNSPAIQFQIFLVIIKKIQITK